MPRPLGQCGCPLGNGMTSVGSTWKAGRYRFSTSATHWAFCAHQRPVVPIVEMGATPPLRNEASVVVIELMVARGGRSLYGALGARFESERASDSLRVIVTAKPDSSPVNADSLISRIEQVEIGLPFEYADGVASGVRSALEHAHLLTAGTLDFAYAATGPASSSQRLFWVLGSAVTQLLMQPDRTVDDDRVVDALTSVAK